MNETEMKTVVQRIRDERDRDRKHREEKAAAVERSDEMARSRARIWSVEHATEAQLKSAAKLAAGRSTVTDAIIAQEILGTADTRRLRTLYGAAYDQIRGDNFPSEFCSAAAEVWCKIKDQL